MFQRKPLAIASAVVVAASLSLTGCANKEEVKDDLSAGSYTVNTITAIGSAAIGAQTAGDDNFMNWCDSTSTSVTPIAVVNTYNQDMTFTVTVNPTLAGNLNFFAAADAGAVGCDNISNSNAGTQSVNVPASTGTPSFTVVGYIVAGGGQTDTNNEGGDNNVAIGAGGTQWYDFWFHIVTATNAFKNLELNYSNTGGTDTSQNVQTGLFNGLDCQADPSTGAISLSSPATLTTPFTSDNANAWTFNTNQPICFGFLQPGSASQG